MKVKFIVQGISIDKCRKYHTDNNMYVMSNENDTWAISMSVIPYNQDENIMDTFFSAVNNGRIITMSDQDDYIKHFKEEFKVFLLERYPEKIISEQKNFDQLFGEECD